MKCVINWRDCKAFCNRYWMLSGSLLLGGCGVKPDGWHFCLWYLNILHRNEYQSSYINQCRSISRFDDNIRLFFLETLNGLSECRPEPQQRHHVEEGASSCYRASYRFFICVNFSVCPTKAFSSDLTFTGPFTSAVSSYMKLKNPSDKKVKALTDLAPITRQTRTSSNNSEVKSEITFLQVCFKIKTTAPKRYLVRPNFGVVDPSNEVQIAVSLLPFE